MRLLFAVSVLLFHVFALTSASINGIWETRLGALAELSIQGFFIISGALVYGSYETSRSLAHYAKKRARRIYPAYLCIILIPASLYILTGGNFTAAIKYIGANLIFLNFLAPDLSGWFELNRFTSVNGALWTLKIEVMFYMALPFIAWTLAKLGRYKLSGLLVIYIAGYLWMVYFSHQGSHIPDSLQAYAPIIARQLPGQIPYFASGMAIWHFRDRMHFAAPWWIWAGGAALALSFTIPYLEIIKPAALALTIAGIAFVKGRALPVAKYGDISYGIYIIHFPILQMLAALGLFKASFVLGVFISSTLIVGLSFICWHIIEKPALKRWM